MNYFEIVHLLLLLYLTIKAAIKQPIDHKYIRACRQQKQNLNFFLHCKQNKFSLFAKTNTQSKNHSISSLKTFYFVISATSKWMKEVPLIIQLREAFVRIQWQKLSSSWDARQWTIQDYSSWHKTRLIYLRTTSRWLTKAKSLSGWNLIRSRLIAKSCRWEWKRKLTQ